MSTREITCHTLHCDVTGCGNSLDDYEEETPLHFVDTDQAIEYAHGDALGWTVTTEAVSYGPRIIERFAVCNEADDAGHDAARKLIVQRGAR